MSAWTVPSYGDQWAVPGYSEERELGRGASGRVVEAVNNATGQRVAIKYLSPALVGDPVFMGGFRTEAQMLRLLGVPQVVQVYDYVEQPGQGAAIVMELVNGVSLHEMIERRGPTGPEAALVVLKGSLLGLAAAHALGIVHRDYKPENVLVDTTGNSKLADFGVAVRAGKRAPAAGTPLYMAPEQWHGAQASPSSDVYAATAVFFECLTGKTPFTGKMSQLREQHVTAPVPIDRVDAPLQGLIAQGMAKNPVERPQNAIEFVAEIESVAAAAYGPDWEERGLGHLAARTAAILPLLFRSGRAGASGTSYGSTWLGGGGRKRKVLTVAAISAAAVVAGGVVAAAVTLQDNGQASMNKSSQVAAVTPTFKAVADVTPPVTTSSCGTPASFTYGGTLTATTRGTVEYQWVYSSGKPGPVQTVSFTGAGHKAVAGETVTTKAAGSGWAEIRVISPVTQTSDKATYRLICNTGTGQVAPVTPPAQGLSATAAVSPPSQALTSCTAATPTLTFSGTISDDQVGQVSYFWKLPSGNGATQTLNFVKAGSQTVTTTYRPASDNASGSGSIVVTSPASVTSNAAAFTVSCGQALTVTSSAPATATVGQAYSGTVTVSGGNGTYTWGAVTGLPAGLAASANGATLTISGTPTAAGTSTVTLTASDTESPPKTASTTLTVTVSAPTVSITTSSLPAGTVRAAYTATVVAAGGTGTTTWAATGLPAGLAINSLTGTISGTPAASGSFTVTVTATAGTNASATYTLVINPPAVVTSPSPTPSSSTVLFAVH